MSFSEFLAALDEPRLLAVARHWQVARGERAMPAWKDIDPVALGRLLPLVWAWRWDAARGAFFGRLAGQEVEDALGGSIRGRPMDAVFGPEVAALVTGRYRAVMQVPAALRSAGKVFRHMGGEGTGERIVLPLAPDASSDGGVLGATVYHLGGARGGSRLAVDIGSVALTLYPLVEGAEVPSGLR